MAVDLVLATDRLIIRDFVMDDLGSVHEYAQDVETTKFMEWGPNSLEETESFLRQAIEQKGKNPRKEFELAVCLASGELIGSIGIHVSDDQNREAWIGYCFNRKYWGRGYASEAAQAIVKYGFEVLGLHRIYARCDPQNFASARVLQKAGMTLEGRLRKHKWWKGEWRDHLILGILEDEYHHMQSCESAQGSADALRRQWPILEFDPSPFAVIEPNSVACRLEEMPRRCVLCFFLDVIKDLVDSGKARKIARCKSEIGEHPIYETEVGGTRIAVFHPGLGGPLAAGLLEDLIALGADSFVACGGAGVLKREIAVGHLILPNAAVRDEGTSYHYLPPAREVTVNPDVLRVLEDTLQRNGYPYVVGKTWTTDAIYRETNAKVQLRKAEGCISVEMECASFLAVAEFRGVKFGQILYGGDDVSCNQWDSRDWTRRKPIRERVFRLAAEACASL